MKGINKRVKLFWNKNFNKSDVNKINSIPPHLNKIGKLYNLFNSEILDISSKIPHCGDSTSYQSPACVDFLRVNFPTQNCYRDVTLLGKIMYVNKPMNRCFSKKLFFQYNAYNFPHWNLNNNNKINKWINKFNNIFTISTYLARCQLEIREWSTNYPTDIIFFCFCTRVLFVMSFD